MEDKLKPQTGYLGFKSKFLKDISKLYENKFETLLIVADKALYFNEVGLLGEYVTWLKKDPNRALVSFEKTIESVKAFGVATVLNSDQIYLIGRLMEGPLPKTCKIVDHGKEATSYLLGKELICSIVIDGKNDHYGVTDLGFLVYQELVSNEWLAP